MARGRDTKLPSPFLRRVLLAENVEGDRTRYPFSLPLFRRPGFELVLDQPVTIIAGENGVGKSTLLEAIAALAGFDEAGGGPGYRPVDHSQATERGVGDLVHALRASWLPKMGRGWFFRAESFFAVARYLDLAARESGTSGPDFLSHSHGEGFLRFFAERCGRQGIYLFDEPESALAPGRQFEFLAMLRSMQQDRLAQAIVVTHSPIIMAVPGATLLRMDRGGLEPVRLEDTDHYRLMRRFVLDPDGTIDDMIGNSS